MSALGFQSEILLCSVFYLNLSLQISEYRKDGQFLKKYSYTCINTLSGSDLVMVFINVPSGPRIFDLLFAVFEIFDLYFVNVQQYS